MDYFAPIKFECMAHVVIIGNGISGITAARHIRKRSDDRITVISAETKYFFSRTALMYIYMGHMKFEHTQPYEPYFWKKNRIDLLEAYVTKIDAEGYTLHLEGGKTLTYDKLILATGSKPNKFGWPGQDLPGVQGLYSYQDLQTLEQNSKNAKRAVIVGGGLIGVELAEMLLTRGIQVSFLVREKRFWGNVLPEGEGNLVIRHMLEHHVDLRLETELKEVLAGPDGKANAVVTSKGETIPCEIVGLTAGVSPNIDFLKDSTVDTQRGILVNEFLETNKRDVYAIGDCAQFHEHPTGRRPIEQVWYTGRMMGETVAQTVTGKQTAYQPGFWFNSAKFFDIEYQTYGIVSARPQEGESSFYWEHAKGKMCLHIVFDSENGTFRGLNVFGIRLRHHVCDDWLRQGRSADYVMEHLRDANFDPELYKQYEAEIVGQYNRDFKKNITLRKRSWSRILNLV